MKIRVINQRRQKYPYHVQVKRVFTWKTIERFNSKNDAITFAQLYLEPELVWEGEIK